MVVIRSTNHISIKWHYRYIKKIKKINKKNEKKKEKKRRWHEKKREIARCRYQCRYFNQMQSVAYGPWD